MNRAASPGSPSALPLHKILQPRFPLSLRESVAQWQARKDLCSAEYAVLDCVELNPTSNTGNFKVKSLDVPVSLPSSYFSGRKKNFSMNELEVVPEITNGSHTVLVHGYGASKGFFYRNFKDLASMSNSTLHALDWLGYGRSSRVPVQLPKFPNRKQGVEYAENFFLTAFENWRVKRNVERFTFVAHSLGAYLACAYASRFPERVEKIVLVSPAAVNRTPHAIPAEQLGTPASPLIGTSPNPPSWFSWMWEQHWSPFALVRQTGPLGPKIASGWASRRFAQLPEIDQESLQRYSYTTFNHKGSGEYMLNYFLACGGVGRWPLVERLDKLKCPTLWLYGDKDWMPLEGGVEAVKRLNSAGLEASVGLVANSGHHLYIDNPNEFHKLIEEFLNRHRT